MTSKEYGSKWIETKIEPTIYFDANVSSVRCGYESCCIVMGSLISTMVNEAVAQ